MSTPVQPPVRLRHPIVWVYFLGGIAGSALNLASSIALHQLAGVDRYLSFLCGTLANQFFHYAYYNVVFVNQETQMRHSWPVRLLLFSCLALASLGPLWVCLDLVGLSFAGAALTTIGLLSLTNTVLVRVSTFSSSQLADIEYCEMGEAFYDDQTDARKVGRMRAWYHSSRFRKLTRWVASHHRPGMHIADLGCGNCCWNDIGLPVTGVDVNEKMLRWAVQCKRICDYRVSADLANTGLPDQGFEMVIMSETIEHLLNLPDVLTEVRRILKPGGTFLVTVPYDFFLGPFFILFNINCFFQGYIRGSRYHRVRCGHVNHFNRKRLVTTLVDNGFDMQEVRVINGLLLYAAAVKNDRVVKQPLGVKGK